MIDNEDFQNLLTYFDKLYSIKDEIEHEYQMIRASEDCKLPLESIRKMFEKYKLKRAEAESPWWKKPFLRAEILNERLNDFLSEMDLFKTLDFLSKLSLLVAVILFIREIPEQAERQKIQERQNRYQAWQIVIAGQDRKSKTSSGRIEALEFLNESKVSLNGLEAPNAYLAEIKLSNADLRGANLQEANLEKATFNGAKIQNAQLDKANLTGANLHFVNLENATLKGANLKDADLSKAILKNTNIQEIISWENADVSSVDFSGNILDASTFYKVKALNNAKFKNTILLKTDPISDNKNENNPEVKKQNEIKQEVIEKIVKSGGFSLQEKIIEEADFTWRQALVTTNNSDEYLSSPENDLVIDNIRKSAAKLAKVQKAIGKPITIISWYKTPQVNRTLRGARYSQHINGLAVDFSVEGMSASEVLNLIRPLPEVTGIGRAKDFIHIDFRPGGRVVFDFPN